MPAIPTSANPRLILSRCQTVGPRGPITYRGGFADNLFEGVGSYSCKTFTTIGHATFRQGKLHGFVQRQMYDKQT